ncbi:MAG: redox-regulated ATPase YchF [bacterium]|nr:redox-regulated ATPase YchF [Planctomycetota bacterium]HIL51399.1 redox-regulated ATPase YchF [Planctomycetota bacterium]
MSVACGIVGLPNIGKSTIFNAVTAAGAESANYPFCTIEPNVGIVDVPDTRLELIHQFIKTDRVLPASLKMVDIAGLVEGASSGEGLGNKFLANIKEVDAICHVVRCFEKGDVVHVHGEINPKRDIEVIELELALADLDTVVRNVERVARKARSGDKDSITAQAVFERAQEALEAGKQLRMLEWRSTERELLRPLFLMTMKPVLFVANVSDDDMDGASEQAQVVLDYALASGSEAVILCGDIEGELSQMEPEERGAFLEELGLEQSGLERLIQQAYKLLGLQTFFTAGEKEIRAWNIHGGDTGPKAAGVIHTDFEKLYIRAEVFSVSDLQVYESEAAVKSAGKLRVEGRDYIMKEGDIAHFLIGKG